MNPNKWTDENILKAYAGHPREREAALLYIYRDSGWKKWVVQHVLHNSGDLNDADVVFQEAIIGLNRSLGSGKFEGSSTLQHYFNRIATFCWLKELAKRRRQKLADLTERENLLPDVSADLEKLFLDEERKNQLSKIVEQAAGERCREILLFVNQGASMEDLAKNFGFSSPEMAKKQKYRCWQRLLGLLRDRPDLKDSLR